MILIAPDKFKGTFTSAEIGKVIEKHLRGNDPEADILRIEMADGGEGTAKIVARLHGLGKHSQEILNPRGDKADAEFHCSKDRKQMVIDSAAFLGRDTLNSLCGYDPMEATTAYLGRFMGSKAIEGVAKLVIGVGGTMTVDGGAALLQEMGYRFLDNRDKALPYPIRPSDFIHISRIIPTGGKLPFLINIKALIDVMVPLLPRQDGELSSLSFAHQKGVEEDAMGKLESGLRNFLKVLNDAFPSNNLDEVGDIGAGGGLAMALKLLGAQLIPGAEFILDKQLEYHQVDCAAISHVYTGEGCLDEQSFYGKVTGTIINRFAKAGIPVTIICGRNALPKSYPLPANVDVKLLSELER